MLPSHPLRRILSKRLALFGLPITLGVAISCATGSSNVFQGSSSTTNNQHIGSSGSSGPGYNGFGDGGGSSFVPPPPPGGGEDGGGGPCDGGQCADFPPDPLNDPNGMVSGDPSSMFGAAGSGSTTDGPCISEPADGALYPYNWLRPRVLWAPGATSQKTFEVRIHADLEANDYVVYTTNNYWIMDDTTWQTIAGVEGGAAGTLVGQTLTVTVRALGASGGTPAISSPATFTIAPAIADGSLIYWTTATASNSPGNTTLQGFHVGDEGTTTALTAGTGQATDVQQTARGQAVANDAGLPLDGGLQKVVCIGCHTATPDGNYVAFTAQWPWPNAMASVQAASPGAVPPWLTPGAIQNMSPDIGGNSDYWGTPEVNQVMMGIQTFSPAHYATGDRIVVSSIGTNWNASADPTDLGYTTSVTAQLIWINLEWPGTANADGSGLPVATPCTNAASSIPNNQNPCLPASTSNGGWGIITRTGDSKSAGAPSWSHNVGSNPTDSIAYVSTNTGIKDGRMNCVSKSQSATLDPNCSADIYVVPYGAAAGAPGGNGGTAKGLSGAADSMYNEYYPSWSPDDAFIAFNRVPAGTSMYNQPAAEVFIVPYNNGSGGSPIRLVANDPVACTKLTSPGVQNTWPKWAPNPASGDAGPAPQTINGYTYYWLTFSSTRSITAGATSTTAGKEQLYVAGIVVDPNGNEKDYPPIYLWNQSDEVNNLIPSWGEFAIPPGKMPPPPPPLPMPPK